MFGKIISQVLTWSWYFENFKVLKKDYIEILFRTKWFHTYLRLRQKYEKYFFHVFGPHNLWDTILTLQKFTLCFVFFRGKKSKPPNIRILNSRNLIGWHCAFWKSSRHTFEKVQIPRWTLNWIYVACGYLVSFLFGGCLHSVKFRQKLGMGLL